MKVYTLPAMFTNDWFGRCMEDIDPDQVAARYLRKGTQMVKVLLTDSEARDLLKDAKYYADSSDDYWDESVRPLNRSASRVVARLKEQMT